MYMGKIQKDIQEIAEAIAELTVKDVIVYDRYRRRVAGTGMYASRMNEIIPTNTLVDKLYEIGEAVFRVRGMNDEYNDVCKSCSIRRGCKELSSIGYPIFLNGEIIGSIWVVACDEYEANRIIKKENEYKRFLKRMSDFIEDKIMNIMNHERLKIEADMINEILNKINDGVLVIDEKNLIKLVNDQACKTLQVDRNMMINQTFEKIFTMGETTDLTKKGLENNLNTWKIRGKEFKIIYSVIPMLVGSRIVNRIITFRKANDILDLAKGLSGNLLFKGIIGNSKAIEDVKSLIEKAAESDSNILLLGETGTGKEIFARTIHRLSKGNEKPFVAVNCASIPEALLESELFGYDKGSFTGALTSGKKGKFELAHGGTLFLDEIGDMPLNLQPKILRVLQEKTIERIGGAGTIAIDVRIISATHKDLRKKVLDEKFRADLYYRINVIPIFLPPLRERGNDVLICAENFADMYCERLEKNNVTFSREVMEYFQGYEWPGNVRELQNVVEYAVNMCKEGEIEITDLPRYIRDKELTHAEELRSLKEKMEVYEKRIIRDTCENFKSDLAGREEAAEILKIGVASLYRKLKKYGI